MCGCRAKIWLSDRSFIRQTPLQLNKILSCYNLIRWYFWRWPIYVSMQSLYKVCGLKFGSIFFWRKKLCKFEWISQFTDKAKVLTYGRSLNDIVLIGGGGRGRHTLDNQKQTKKTPPHFVAMVYFFYNEKILWKCQNPGYPAWRINIIPFIWKNWKVRENQSFCLEN